MATKLPELTKAEPFITDHTEYSPYAAGGPTLGLGTRVHTMAIKSAKEITDALMQPFPESEIKEREGSRGKMLRYVTGASVIRRLIQATDNHYHTRLVEKDWVTVGGKPAMLVVVELEIPPLGKRQGYGIQILTERGGEDLYKGAYTDAIKKAATQFGVALELYFEEEEVVADASAPVVANLDGDLKQALNRKGVKTIGDLKLAVKKRFGHEGPLTIEQQEEWKEELRKVPI